MAEEKRRIKRQEVSDANRVGTRRNAVKPQSRENASASSPTNQAAPTQQAGAGSQMTIEQFVNSYMSQAAGSFRQTVWGPGVAKKESIARRSFGVPSQEKVLLILDCSPLGTCQAGLAFGLSGIYLRDSRGTTGSLAWKDLPRCKLAYGSNVLALANCQFATVDGAALCKLLQQIAARL